MENIMNIDEIGIPSADEVKESIKKNDKNKIDKFYNFNMVRIARTLDDFIENPEQVESRGHKVWLYIYEYGKHELEYEKKDVFQKELNIIIDNLKAKGYDCHIGRRESPGSRRGEDFIVSLEIDFNDTEEFEIPEIKGFWRKLFWKRWY